MLYGTFSSGRQGPICRSPSDGGAWIVPARGENVVLDRLYALKVTGQSSSGNLRFARAHVVDIDHVRGLIGEVAPTPVLFSDLSPNKGVAAINYPFTGVTASREWLTLEGETVCPTPDFLLDAISAEQVKWEAHQRALANAKSDLEDALLVDREVQRLASTIAAPIRIAPAWIDTLHSGSVSVVVDDCEVEQWARSSVTMTPLPTPALKERWGVTEDHPKIFWDQVFRRHGREMKREKWSLSTYGATAGGVHVTLELVVDGVHYERVVSGGAWSDDEGAKD